MNLPQDDHDMSRGGDPNGKVEAPITSTGKAEMAKNVGQTSCMLGRNGLKCGANQTLSVRGFVVGVSMQHEITLSHVLNG
jgi:hypothetical protein